MKRLVKVILIIVLSLGALLGLLVTCTGLTIRNSVKDIEQQTLNTGSAQSVTMNSGGVTVNTTLQSKRIIVLKGVHLCEPYPDVYDSAGSSTGCVNGLCETSLAAPDTLPASLVIHRDDGGQCVEQTLSNIASYVVTAYQGVVAFEPTAVQQLALSEQRVGKTENSRFSGSTLVGINDNLRITLDYGSSVPSQDEFMMGSKLIKVMYAAHN